jgi:hypothetical protein
LSAGILALTALLSKLAPFGTAMASADFIASLAEVIGRTRRARTRQSFYLPWLSSMVPF